MDAKLRSETACEILGSTNDGDDLSPNEMSLVQDAVNGFLNDYGYKTFEALHRLIMGGSFVPFQERFFRGVENITADGKGAGGGLWIYYKGNHIEHYDSRYAQTDEGLKELKELQRRCMILEGAGKEVNSGTVLWGWNDE